MKKVETVKLAAKGLRKITVEAYKNGILVTGAEMDELNRLNDNYGNGLDWAKEGQGYVLPGLFGVTDIVLNEIEQGVYKF